MKVLRTVAFLALSLAWAQTAMAETLNVNSVSIQPSVSTETGIAVDGGRMLPHLGGTVGFAFGYANQPLVMRNISTGDIAYAVLENQVMLHLVGALGLFGYGEVAIDAPMAMYQSGGGLSGDGDIGGFGLGDIRINLKGGYPIDDMFRLAGAVDLTLPTGDDSKGLASGFSATVRVAGSVLLERIAPINIHFNAGARLRGDRIVFAPRVNVTDINEPRTPWLTVGNELVWGVGLEAPLLTGIIAPVAEIFGFASLSDPFAKTSETSMEWLLGLRARPIGPLALQVGGGSGIMSGYGTPRYRVMLTAVWTPGRLDADGDGIPDKLDRCPREPEDLDDFEDRDGCPDPDNDSDNVFDKDDKCPLDAEDKDGWEDDDGCPDPDNDGDGIPDGDDKCPDEAEDKDGYLDDDGCPDPDNDGDGIPDKVDKCPDQPETVNGVDDEDGCPDQAGGIEVRGANIIFAGGFPIDARNPGSLTAKAREQLKLLAALLVASPKFKMVRIETHTDNQGGSRRAKKRTEAMADAVFDFLVGEGVDLGRLDTKAFGMERPVGPNSSPEDRAGNRRVEFRIVEQE